MADFLQGEMLAGRRCTEDLASMVCMHLRGMLEADLVNRALIGFGCRRAAQETAGPRDEGR